MNRIYNRYAESFIGSVVFASALSQLLAVQIVGRYHLALGGFWKCQKSSDSLFPVQSKRP